MTDACLKRTHGLALFKAFFAPSSVETSPSFLFPYIHCPIFTLFAARPFLDSDIFHPPATSSQSPSGTIISQSCLPFAALPFRRCYSALAVHHLFHKLLPLPPSPPVSYWLSLQAPHRAAHHPPSQQSAAPPTKRLTLLTPHFPISTSQQMGRWLH